MYTLYTLGYTGRKPEELKALVADGKLILDVRYSANSRVPQWRKAELEKLLGEGYLSAPSLGNLNYRGPGPVQLADPTTGFRVLGVMLHSCDVVLLCACKDHETCHRSVIADEAQARWPELEVVHL